MRHVPCRGKKTGSPRESEYFRKVHAAAYVPRLTSEEFARGTTAAKPRRELVQRVSAAAAGSTIPRSERVNDLDSLLATNESQTRALGNVYGTIYEDEAG